MCVCVLSYFMLSFHTSLFWTDLLCVGLMVYVQLAKGGCMITVEKKGTGLTTREKSCKGKAEDYQFIYFYIFKKAAVLPRGLTADYRFICTLSETALLPLMRRKNAR